MSLIHEALKKVERQRHLGKAPSLDSPAYSRGRRRRWPWVMVLLVILVVAGAWHWRAALLGKGQQLVAMLMDRNESVSSQPAKSVAASGTVVQVQQREQPLAMAKPDNKAQDRSRVVRQHQSGSRSAPGSTAGSAGSNARRGNASAANERPALARSAQSKAGNNTREGNSKPAARAVQAPQRTDRQPPASGVAKQASGNAQPAARKGPPMYWELPYAQRNKVPDLRITMHLYTRNRADRFVIINGVRHAEGDDLADGVKLVSINPDGITLSLGGTRFRVPRQGMN